MKKSYRLVILATLVPSVWACAPFETPKYEPPKQSHKQNDDSIKKPPQPQTTGLTEVVPYRNSPSEKQELIYTPSGDVDKFEELYKTETSQTGYSKEFSKKIRAASIIQKIENDLRKFTIKLELEDLNELIEFSYETTLNDVFTEKTLETSSPSKDGFEYSLDVTCEVSDCSSLRMTLKKLKEQKVIARTSMLYSVKVKDYRIEQQSDKQQNSTPPLAEQLKKESKVREINLSVVDGVSRSELTINDENSQAPILKIETPIADTHSDAVPAENFQAQGVSEVLLQGNNPESGERVIDIKDNQGNVTRIHIGKKDEINQNITDVPSDFINNYKSAIIPLISNGISIESLEQSLEVTSRLELYRNSDKTLKYIQYFQSNQPTPNKIGSCEMNVKYNKYLAQSFLTQMKTKIPQINLTLGELTSRILNKADSPIQTAYLVALESPYMNNGFNADIIASYQKAAGYADNQLKEIGKRRWEFWSDAAGPYQCLTDTCRYIIRKNKSLLERAGLSPQVFYVTPMEREYFNQAVSSGKTEEDIKRGEIRRTIFNSGREAEYAEQRKNASLHPDDSRKYFATATLLAGLVINEDLIEKKVFNSGENPAIPDKLEFKRKLRKDPSLAYYAYRAGANEMIKSAICSQMSDLQDREACLDKLSREQARSKRHEGFDATLEQITEMGMADCKYLNYTWAWLALQFIGSDPDSYGIHLGTPDARGINLEDVISQDMLAFIESENTEKEQTL
ncbi:MAG: hypothetical protein KDD58_00470 [Bdellovibrionales bacterium]|nr:hypothetical protein [Bdellovibrionales bacterium]